MELKTSAIQKACEELEIYDIEVSHDHMEKAITAFLQRGGYVLVEAYSSDPLDRAKTDLSKLKVLIDMDVGRAASEEDWRVIFTRIFDRKVANFSTKARSALALLGYRFPDYHDPDTSYEEDARAWIGAFDEVYERVFRKTAGETD